MITIAKLKDTEYEDIGHDHIRKVARGVVLNDKNEVALIKLHGQDIFGDRNYYETPGGGVKKHERIKKAVEREVEEELGLKCKVIKELGIVEDFYNLLKRKNINYYFLLKVYGNGSYNREPFEKKFFEKVVWSNIDQAISLMEGNPNQKLGLLVKNRELPILKIAKQIIEEENIY